MNKRRFEVLDIFRGVFSSLVVFYHMAFYTKSVVLKNDFIGNSFLFVDFFFILSGFVIFYTYNNIQSFEDLKSYIKKRFFRLYPLHLIALIAFLCYEVSKHVLKNNSAAIGPLTNVHNNTVDFFSNLFLLNSVKIPGINSLSWNYPSWSISAEMISYFCFGLVSILLFNLKIKRFFPVVNILIIATIIGIFYSINHNFYFFETYNYGFLRGILGFFTGGIAFSIYSYFKFENVKPSKIIYSLIEFFTIVVIILTIIYAKSFITNFGYLIELLFLISILIFSFEGGIISQGLLKSNFLKNAGKYSYSIYMLHAFINIIFNLLVIKICKVPASYYSFLFIINYLIIYFISAWSYKHIEMRFNTLSKKNNVSAK